MVFHSARQIWLALLCSLLVACGGGTAKKEQPPPIQPGEDPLYALQWHLLNYGQSYGKPGIDVNVDPVWASCDDGKCRGEGVRIAIVDDGLEIRHPDLWPNWVPGGGLNFLTGGRDPTPGLIKDQQLDNPNDSHGTSVAGLAAARDNNSEGGRGVAPRAQVVGYNLLKQWSLSNEMTAMTHNHALVDVSNNSWGATDNTGQLQPAELTWRNAVEYGLEQGRNGRGTVYVWAAGNGGKLVEERNGTIETRLDNSNYDGRANFHGVMAIGAVEHNGQKADYSEEGANLWLVAPGGNGDNCATRLITTDLTGPAGLNNGASSSELQAYPDYTRCMAGTSAATPLVSGVAALVLQARPELTWRDVRLVLAESARRDRSLRNAGWSVARSGYHHEIRHSHGYGFGLVNAEEAVRLAKTWLLLPPQKILEPVPPNAEPGARVEVSRVIDSSGARSSITVSDDEIDFIEWVDVEFSSNHSYAGNLEITLISPSGTESRLSLPHGCRNPRSGEWIEDCTESIADENGVWKWRFGSARHLGENAYGVWEMRVTDATTSPVNGSGDWLAWRLIIRGHTREQ